MIEYQQLISIAAREAGMEPERYRALIDTYFEVVLAQLDAGNDVLLHESIGRLVLRARGGESNDGNKLKRAYMTPVFKGSNRLKRICLQDAQEYVTALRESGREKTADALQRQYGIG